jgi:putative ABC transport system permease protein
VDVWGAFPVDAPFTQSRQPAWLSGIGRLKPGVTIEQARADLAHVQAQLAELYPDTDRTIGVHVEPLKDTIVGAAGQSLWFLFGAVLVLLLIACTNIAALLLSRAAERETDVAIRYSLGASRRAIVRQILTETAAPAFGAVLACPYAGGVKASECSPDLPRVDEIAFDGRMFLYTVASVAVVTLLCGAFPAIRSARRNRTLSQSSRGQVSLRHSLQWLLVGVQVALSVMLLTGAGLLVRSVEALSRVDLGFDTTNVLTFSVTGRFGEAGGYDGLVQRINTTLDELAVLAGVEAWPRHDAAGRARREGKAFDLVRAAQPMSRA